jgi:signal transduction histidine kinase
MLGYRSGADVRDMDVLSAVFECPEDLRWLVERTLRTGKVESVKTTLKTRDQRRLAVRLHALTSDGPIVVAVEDLTKLSVVEHRLREAQRLEAVGRVASEVAVTCDTLLREVSQGGRQWLAGFASDTELRQQGELLLGDVTRAAGFLRQFMAYGHKEMSNLEPVNVQRVMRDLEPVLMRVLGDEIMLSLPKTADRFEVDVDRERVERILVNVANFARERMPHGGRVKIHLANTFVEQRFLERYPKVRPGAHVLITITETRGPTWRALPVQLPTTPGLQGERAKPARENPGMDPGPLVALIGHIGGNLWMSAEPGGNMTLQLHLPKRMQADMFEQAAAGSWTDRGRQLARWFRH